MPSSPAPDADTRVSASWMVAVRSRSATVAASCSLTDASSVLTRRSSAAPARSRRWRAAFSRALPVWWARTLRRNCSSAVGSAGAPTTSQPQWPPRLRRAKAQPQAAPGTSTGPSSAPRATSAAVSALRARPGGSRNRSSSVRPSAIGR